MPPVCRAETDLLPALCPPQTSPTLQLVTPVAGSAVPPARYGHAAGLVDGQVMVIFGGTASTGVLNDLWEYDISKNSWRSMNPSMCARVRAGAPLDHWRV